MKRLRPAYVGGYAAGAGKRRAQARRRRKWRSFARSQGILARPGYTTVPRTRGWAGNIGEMKYFDSGLSSISVTASTDWTGTEHDPAGIGTLFVPQQGSGIDQRIGQGCDIHKIKLRGHISSVPQTGEITGDSASIVRIILYQDMQTNAAQSQGEQLMQSAGTAARNVHSYQNVDNFGRFRVLKDRKFVLDPNDITWNGTNLTQQGTTRNWRMNCNFRTPLRVRFNAVNGGTVADIVDNSFHIIAITSNTGLDPGITYQCRVSYKE